MITESAANAPGASMTPAATSKTRRMLMSQASIRHLRHPGQDEALHLPRALDVAEVAQGGDQHRELRPRHLAGIGEEFVLLQEVIGLGHVLGLELARLDHDPD